MAKLRVKKAGRPRKGEGIGAALGREVIFRKALELIGHRGHANFNMRELARALGVFPAAVYWHVPSRIDLIAGVVELAMSDMPTMVASDSWQVQLRKLLYQFRDVLHRHPGLAPVVATELVKSITVDAERMNQIILALEDAGFEKSGLIDAYNVVIAAMCGFATLELSSIPAEEASSWEASCRRQIDAIDRSRFPGLGRHVSALRNNAFMLRWSSGKDKPLDRSFAAWVEVVISGLEQLAGARHPNRQKRPARGAKLHAAPDQSNIVPRGAA